MKKNLPKIYRCILLALTVWGLIFSLNCRVSAASLSTPKITGAKSLSGNAVKLTWKKVSGAKGYLVYYRKSSSGSYKAAAKVKGDTTLTVEKLACGQKYDFRVRAYKSVSSKNVFSSCSKAVTVTVVPPAPKTVKASLYSNGNVKVKWTAVSGISGYYIYRRTAADTKYTRIANAKASATGYRDSGVTGSETYYYKLVSFKTVNGKKIKGSASKAAVITTPKVFTVSPTSTPYNNRFVKGSNYTKATQAYYMLRSYLEMFADTGGGELCLQKGTYDLQYPLYVPSNVTIRFSDGVVIRNSGTSGSRGLFILDDYRDRNAGKKYYSYNGVHDVKLIGEGTVIFDKQYKPNAGLMIVHTKNVLIDGITFCNMRSATSHFIELDASYNTEIRNCTFTGHDSSGPKEAINLDVPDSATGGLSWKGSSMDKTADDNIYIHDNVFEDLPSGLGSHMFTKDHPHRNIRIENNVFRSCGYFGIRAQNWEGVSICNNTFSLIRSGNSDEPAIAIEARGIKDVEIRGNQVSACDSFLIIKLKWYSEDTIAAHPGLADYGIVYNEVSKEDVIHNSVSGLAQPYDIYYNNTNDGRNGEYWMTEE